MAKYTKIDVEACIACGACSAEAPDVYGEKEDGIAYSLLDDNAGTTEIDDAFIDDAEAACDGCPTEAVQIQDTPFS